MDIEHIKMLAIQDQSEATIEEMWQIMSSHQHDECVRLAYAIASKTTATDELRFLACIALVAMRKLPLVER